MVFEISVLKFHVMPTGQDSLDSAMFLNFVYMLESLGNTVKNTFARAPLRDSDSIDPGQAWAWCFLKVLQVNQTCTQGSATMGSHLYGNSARLKSQEPEVQAPNFKITYLESIYTFFTLQFLHLLIPSLSREFFTCGL